MKPKTCLIVATSVLAVTIAISLFAAPLLDRRDMLRQQNVLLDSIADDIAEAVIYEPVEPTTEPTATEYEPLPTDEPTPPPTLEPLPDSEFPDAIVGIGILTVPKIGLRLPIMEGVDEVGLRIAPGHVPQTAAVGEIGNAVIAGHRMMLYHKSWHGTLI